MNKKIFSILEEEGVTGLLRKVVRRYVFKKQRFVCLNYDLTAPMKVYKPSKRWDIREVIVEDLVKTEKYLSKYTENYYELLEAGCKAFGGFDKESGDIIAIVCFADKDFYDKHYLKCLFPVGPRQIYQFAGELALPFRGRPISIQILKAAWNYFEGKGKTETYASVDIDNITAVRYHFHLGFKEMGEVITSYTLFGVKWNSRSRYAGEMLTQYKKTKKK